MKKKIALNMSSTLLLEIVSLVCAFILPRLILINFGSQYNGIVSSVTQFLSFITLLRGGIGGVTRAALYKPLQEKNIEKISGILKATEQFMRKVTYIFVVFLLCFAALYPFLVKEDFGWVYTFSLVLILGITTISQYYFGITYQMLIQADQKQYVYSILQTFATILNTFISVILINTGVEFRIVKLVSALVFGAIPIILYYYVHRKYTLIKDVPADNSAIRQRWDAFAHQVAGFINSNTDIMILTIFSNLYQVSIYTVYFMVVNGIKRFVNVFSNGIDAAIGNLIARNADSTLQKGILYYEWIIHVASTIAFTCTAVLIVPFIMIYTQGVTDTDYYKPLFGYLLCIAQFAATTRLPYLNVVEAAGRFRDTKNGAIAEAVINIALTIPFVIAWGCTGAVVGTIAATVFRTVQYAVYASRKLLNRSLIVFLKRYCISIFNICLIVAPYLIFGLDIKMLKTSSYIAWAEEAFVTFIVVAIITVTVNYVFYKKETKEMLTTIFGLVLSKIS